MKRAFALSLLLMFGVGCRTPLPGTLLPAGDPLPELRLEALRSAAGSRVALRATARLDLDGPGLELNRPQRIALERPARLRVEILGLFNQLAAVVVTDGTAYQVYRAGEGDLETGLVHADLLWNVARIDLLPGEAVDLLLGVPRPDPTLVRSAARRFEDGALEIERVDSSDVLRERLRFDASGRLAALARFDRAGGLVFTARFADYRDVEAEGGSDGEARVAAAQFAYEVDLDFPRVEATARFQFKRVSLPADIPDGLFELKLPDRTTEPR